MEYDSDLVRIRTNMRSGSRQLGVHDSRLSASYAPGIPFASTSSALVELLLRAFRGTAGEDEHGAGPGGDGSQHASVTTRLVGKPSGGSAAERESREPASKRR